VIANQRCVRCGGIIGGRESEFWGLSFGELWCGSLGVLGTHLGTGGRTSGRDTLKGLGKSQGQTAVKGARRRSRGGSEGFCRPLGLSCLLGALESILEGVRAWGRVEIFFSYCPKGFFKGVRFSVFSH
jgi:hypothetical protein